MDALRTPSGIIQNLFVQYVETMETLRSDVKLNDSSVQCSLSV